MPGQAIERKLRAVREKHARIQMQSESNTRERERKECGWLGCIICTCGERELSIFVPYKSIVAIEKKKIIFHLLNNKNYGNHPYWNLHGTTSKNKITEAK